MKYHTCLFDMDGTVLDTVADLRDALNHTLMRYGYPACDTQRVMAATGNGARSLVAALLPQGEATPAFEAIFSDYKAYYAAHSCVKTAPYPEITALLQTLREGGCKVAIVSNKPDGAVKELAARFFPGVPAFGEAGLPRKPAPDMVFHALRVLGAARENAVYIGDSEVDVATAQNAGLDMIAVSWGFRSRSQLAQCGASTIVDSVAELRKKCGIPH